jgi:uncharacterized protein (TIGR03435 family)
MPEFLPRSPQAFEGRIFTSADGEHVLATVGRGVSTSQLAEELSEALQTFVWDRTGLPGKYYFGFRFQSVVNPGEGVEAGSVFSVLSNELGLRLEKQKGPVELLVVDHFEKPSPN